MTIPFRAGGGTDALGRIYAKYFGTQVGGTVAVNNKDAAGGIEGNNYLYAAAKKDGSEIGYVELTNTWTNDLAKAPGCTYKMAEFYYIGGLAATAHIFWVKGDSPYKTVDDLKAKKGLKFGCTGATSVDTQSAAVVIDALKLDAKLVTGFKGRSDVVLALQKGEIDAFAFPGPGLQPYVDKGEFRPFCIVASERDKVLFPNTPSLKEITSISDDTKQELEFLDAMIISKGVIMPPGTPKDMVDYLRKLTDDIAKRSDYQKEVMDYFGIMSYYNGKDITEVVKGLSQKAEVLKKLADLVSKYKA